MDIVEKLRSFGPDWTREHNGGKPIPYEYCADAADEIERLRELVKSLAKEYILDHGAKSLKDKYGIDAWVAGTDTSGKGSGT